MTTTDRRQWVSVDGDGSRDFISLEQVLLSMSYKDFKDVVDRDIRSNLDELTKKAESPKDRERLASLRAHHDALRAEAVCERWFQCLLRMKKSCEMTLAAKMTEDKAVRHEAMFLGTPDVAQQHHAAYLRWRAGALRFLTGVEETLTDANYHRNRHMTQASTLLAAIRRHRDESRAAFDDQDIDPIDEALWSVLDDNND